MACTRPGVLLRFKKSLVASLLSRAYAGSTYQLYIEPCHVLCKWDRYCTVPGTCYWIQLNKWYVLDVPLGTNFIAHDCCRSYWIYLYVPGEWPSGFDSGLPRWKKYSVENYASGEILSQPGHPQSYSNLSENCLRIIPWWKILSLVMNDTISSSGWKFWYSSDHLAGIYQWYTTKQNTQAI